MLSRIADAAINQQGAASLQSRASRRQPPLLAKVTKSVAVGRCAPLGKVPPQPRCVKFSRGTNNGSGPRRQPVHCQAGGFLSRILPFENKGEQKRWGPPQQWGPSVAILSSSASFLLHITTAASDPFPGIIYAAHRLSLRSGSSFRAALAARLTEASRC